MKKLLIADNLKTIIEKNKKVLSMEHVKIITDSSGKELLKVHSREKIRILAASSGKDILNIHNSENTDLIITSLEMPKMDGDKVCSAIRNNDTTKKVSFIIVCDNNKSAIKRCRTCKANAFITKPIKSQELISNIKKFLYISERKSIRAIFQVFFKGRSKEKFFFGSSENISSSGILLSTDEVLRKGAKITCTFLIGKKLTTVNGKVVRTVKAAPARHSYGIQFTDLSPTTQSRIDKFIKKK